MKAMKATRIIGILAICIGMMSCQDEEKTNVSTVEPGTYAADIIINPESGSTNYSRGINAENGIFTSEYQQDYIYLHRINGDETETYQSVKIDLGEDCENSSKCFNIQVIKSEDEKTFTINAGGQSITLNANEKIYFSTIPAQIWEATKSSSTNNSPIEGTPTIFEQPENADGVLAREILKSAPCTGDELIDLMMGDTQYIDVTRHCTGFKIHILFTNSNVTEDQPHVITSEEWHQILDQGEKEINPEDFEIKIYFGPNFCSWYDVLNNTSEGYGYYASHNQTYTAFEEVDQTYNNIDYQGYGYNTELTLLSPLYTGMSADDFRIYVCIRYNGNEYYYQVAPKGLTMNTNTIHHLILAYDVHDLLPIVNGTGGTYSSESRAGSAYQKIDLKPFKIICE